MNLDTCDREGLPGDEGYEGRVERFEGEMDRVSLKRGLVPGASRTSLDPEVRDSSTGESPHMSVSLEINDAREAPA